MRIKNLSPVMERRKTLGDHRRLATRLWVWHLCTGAFMVVLILGAHGLTWLKKEQAATDAEIVNISGRQRMLSQRILYFGAKHYRSGDEDATNDMRDAIARFESGHLWLTENAIDEGRLETFYFDQGAESLDARTRAFIADARALATAVPLSQDAREILDSLSVRGETALLSKLNEAVGLFEARAGERRDALMNLQIAITAILVLTVVAEILLIFRPITQSILSVVKRLDIEANLDALTGLANRKRLFELLDDQIQKAVRADREVVVINVDLDGFKAVNDTLGHPAGDAVLVHVARLLERIVPVGADGDAPIIARLGGDEFVISMTLHDRTPMTEVEALGARLLEAVRLPFSIDLGKTSEECVIGMSLGYAHSATSGTDRSVLVANADIALYQSKRAGKNRMTCFEPHMREAAERRHRLENDLRHAVLNGEFEPNFELQVALDTGEPTGVEMLARWRHPEKGLLDTDAFLSTAEDLGVIDMIEGNLILAAIECFAGLRKQGHMLPKLAFNVSTSTVTRPDFAENLAGICDLNGLSAGIVVLEISDQDISNRDNTELLAGLGRLSGKGFGLVIDGFGTGASTLPLLSKVDLVGLKLSPSLVSNISDPRNERIVATAIYIAKGMEIQIAAVGVETEDHLDRLRLLGCNLAQGPAIAAAGDIDTLHAWLSNRQKPSAHLKSLG